MSVREIEYQRDKPKLLYVVIFDVFMSYKYIEFFLLVYSINLRNFTNYSRQRRNLTDEIYFRSSYFLSHVSIYFEEMRGERRFFSRFKNLKNLSFVVIHFLARLGVSCAFLYVNRQFSTFCRSGRDSEKKPSPSQSPDSAEEEEEEVEEGAGEEEEAVEVEEEEGEVVVEARRSP